MKNWFKVLDSQVVVKQNYKTWGTRFWNTKTVAWEGFKYFYKDRTNPSYLRIVSKHSLLLSKKRDFVKVDYYDPILMAHVKKNLPKFENFSTNFYSFLLLEWDNSFDGGNWQSAGKIVVVEEELYQRDRLLQIFGACPKGSYGYYAGIALTPFKFAVQSFAAARIDEFFASVAEFLIQPFGPEINGIMTGLESTYWYTLDQRTEFVNWAAGQLLSQEGRALPPYLVQRWETFRSAKLRTPMEDGRVLTAKQLEAIEDVMVEMLPILNGDALKGLTKVLNDLFEEKIKEKASLKPPIEKPEPTKTQEE